MGLITRLYNFIAGETIEPSQVNAEFNQILNLLNGNIENNNINAGAAIAESKIAGQPAEFSAYRTGGQTITNSVWTKAQWTTKTFDTGSYLDIVTNHRFTPGIAGKYQINADARITPVVSTTDIAIAIYKNGSLYRSSYCGVGGVTLAPSVSISDVIAMNGTDYLEIFVYHVSSASTSFSSGFFSGHRTPLT